MTISRHNPEAVFPPYSNYSHAVEVRGDVRMLFISGLNGYRSDRVTMPESFEEQAEQIDHCPSLTVVCSQLLDPAWKLELEAVAAR